VSERAAAASSRPIAIVLVAAVAENGVIGRDNALPWRLKSDMRRFRSLTLGKPMVMGRKTFLSVGKALGGRTNIVVSRDRNFAAPGVIVAPDVDAALAVARGDALRRGADAIAVIGGADVYAQTLPLADRLEMTVVKARPEGDTRFPPFDRALWREIEHIEHRAGPDDVADFAYVTYVRTQ
jgi:dihydrofolate reductase